MIKGFKKENNKLIQFAKDYGALIALICLVTFQIYKVFTTTILMNVNIEADVIFLEKEDDGGGCTAHLYITNIEKLGTMDRNTKVSLVDSCSELKDGDKLELKMSLKKIDTVSFF